MRGDVLVVDDDPDFRLLVRLALAGRTDLRIVGEAADADAARRQVVDRSPDVVLLDVGLDGPGPLALAAELESLLPGALVVLASARPGGEPSGPPGRARPVLSKGLVPTQLTDRMAALLETRARTPVVDTAAGSFPASPSSAGEARRMVRRTLEEWGTDDDLLETAVLLTSEVVTNAVQHARSAVELCLSHAEDRIRIAVIDSGSGLIRRRRVEADDQSGRGTELVETLSDGWGIEREGGAKQVWFELRTDARGR